MLCANERTASFSWTRGVGKVEWPPQVLMVLKIELDQEEDGRWIAEVIDIPGALAYGATSELRQI